MNQTSEAAPTPQANSTHDVACANPAARPRCAQIERDIITRYRKKLWVPFIKALTDYQLICDGDRIAVCVSGGKDSFLLAKLFQELYRHGRRNFEVMFLSMDPGYPDYARQSIANNAELLGIPLEIAPTNIFEIVKRLDGKPCYPCARMRRGALYNAARELGCNKIALGHHFDDVVETILMSVLYGGQVKTMMPKLHSTNYPGMELIRPLYLVREDDIKAWRDYNGLHFIQCACKFTDTCTTCNDGQNHSKRQETKELIRELKKSNPDVEKCIFSSVENVNIDTVLAYKKDGIKHSFLDEYDSK